MITGDIIADSQKYLMNTYARQPLVLIKGRGMKVFDSDGREYYDYVAGVATNNLGHCHPRVVVALQTVLAGITQGETLAVAASTLVAFAIFQPVRRRVQSAVDRRFDRARYDAQRTVDTFAEHLRSEVDLGRLRSALVVTADRAVRPVGAAIWLRAGSEG